MHLPSRRRLDNESLLYWSLLILILVSYLLLVFVLAAAFPLHSGRFDTIIRILLNVVAAIILLATFRPICRWVQAGVRDLVYGQHESPYPALAQLNQQLESTPSPQSILPTIAFTIAETLNLPYVEIEAYQAADYRAESAATTSFGARPGGVELESLPLLYHNIKIGELRVAAQRWDVPLSPSDLSVLSELARQVGIALYAAHLTDDLQRARERLVLTREEERRRIRNDLHDGLAPALSSLQLQLSAIRRLIQQDPERAEAMTNELSDDLRAAIAEIRQLIYDLRPPMLDDLGLVAALKSLKLNDALRLEIDAPDPLPKLPAAVEVALYRIASEALHNVVRHANASECVVYLTIVEDHVLLTIRDNGKTQPETYTAGIGLHSMRERAEELSGALTIQPGERGGTQVIARLPLPLKSP